MGSNPTLSASCEAVVIGGDVAQLGERLVRNEEVSGSIPLISTISLPGRLPLGLRRQGIRLLVAWC